MLHGAEISGRIQTGEESLKVAAWLIFFGMVFDSLDGQIARLTRSVSQFGKELDSLADMITFGVAPAFLIEVLSFNNEGMLGVIHSRERMLLSAAYAVFAALRLARYNVNVPKSKGGAYFSGMPSPAAAGILAGLILVYYRLATLSPYIADVLKQWSPIIAAVLGLLMVSGLRFPHFANLVVRSKLSFHNIVMVAVVLLLLYMFREYMLFSGFVAYGIVSLAIGIRLAFSKQPDETDAPPQPNEEEG